MARLSNASAPAVAKPRSATQTCESPAMSGTLRFTAEKLLTLAPDSEQALFQVMYVPVCNFAVFQHNVCKRTVLAHEIYAWLHRHAGSDAAALKLLAGNMKASQG